MSRQSFIRQAFDLTCPGAKEPERWFVCLMESAPYYGGPEEGGWWGRDTQCVAFQEFPTRELADEAAARVTALAADLREEARRSFGRHMPAELDWLAARGLDADFLPEPDGPSEYYVCVGDTVPAPACGSRHYE